MRTRLLLPLRRTRRIRAGSAAAAVTVTAALLFASGVTVAHADQRAPSHPADPARAVLSTEQSTYGTVLDLGAGAGYAPGSSTPVFPAGSAVYMSTIDPPAHGDGHGYRPGCGTTLVTGPLPGGMFAGGIPGPLSCTGAETDQQADWQALTTDRPAIAGAGVGQRLLGRVYRPDLGTFQVTYAGHPLYLFLPGIANAAFGDNIFESTLPLPPWQTAWYLLSPDGQPAVGPATIQTETLPSGQTVLANQMLPGIGGVPIAVYTFSRDHAPRSTCSRACARTFIPVLTDGAPVAGAGATASAIGTTTRADGTQQVTYHRHPLYMYSQEQVTGLTGTAGNGNGTELDGGTFSLLTP
jgi:predicted lipoprotein with Yx(FWY)xxD motif